MTLVLRMADERHDGVDSLFFAKPMAIAAERSRIVICASDVSLCWPQGSAFSRREYAVINVN
jgi:hypothetical protein